MIDYGLLVSMIIGFGIPSLLGSWWPVSGRDGPVGFFDVAVMPAFAGVAVGRLALDDPSSIGSISDLLIIRSGVEFWPGVAAGIVAVLVGAHRGLVEPHKRLAELTPLAMIGYAGFEAACIFRDGCFGPESAIGLRPPGVATTMLPVGWLMAAAIGVATLGVNALVRGDRPPLVAAVASVMAVASVRSVGSIWLPHVGDGLTRQHLSSIAVALASLAVACIVLARRRMAGP